MPNVRFAARVPDHTTSVTFPAHPRPARKHDVLIHRGERQRRPRGTASDSVERLPHQSELEARAWEAPQQPGIRRSLHSSRNGLEGAVYISTVRQTPAGIVIDQLVVSLPRIRVPADQPVDGNRVRRLAEMSESGAGDLEVRLLAEVGLAAGPEHLLGREDERAWRQGLFLHRPGSLVPPAGVDVLLAGDVPFAPVLRVVFQALQNGQALGTCGRRDDRHFLLLDGSGAFAQPRQPGVAVFAPRGQHRQKGRRVYRAHLTDLLSLIDGIVLHDAEAVDPKVVEPQECGELDAIGDGARKALLPQCSLVLEDLPIALLEAGVALVSPDVAQREVLDLGDVSITEVLDRCFVHIDETEQVKPMLSVNLIRRDGTEDCSTYCRAPLSSKLDEHLDPWSPLQISIQPCRSCRSSVRGRRRPLKGMPPAACRACSAGRSVGAALAPISQACSACSK